MLPNLIFTFHQNFLNQYLLTSILSSMNSSNLLLSFTGMGEGGRSLLHIKSYESYEYSLVGSFPQWFG